MVFETLGRKIVGLPTPGSEARIKGIAVLADKSRKDLEDYDSRIATYNAHLDARDKTASEALNPRNLMKHRKISVRGSTCINWERGIAGVSSFRYCSSRSAYEKT